MSDGTPSGLKGKNRKQFSELLGKFKDLAEKGPEEQMEAFLKSFIFNLGDKWKDVGTLLKAYRKYITEGGENQPDLNLVQAADFLQKNGAERTANQRSAEIADIDLDNNKRICFIEYLLLQFKVMILNAYYTRTEESNPYDLSQNGVGISGVGYYLLDELFAQKSGLPPELQEALEELTAVRKERAATMKQLAATAEQGGVKGGKAANELAQMHAGGEPEEEKKIEAKINSAMRKNSSGAGALKKKQAEEKKAEEMKRTKSKEALAAKVAAMGLQ
eukprot:Lithocolla_globosa_v1_NODE_7631_length_921_cov_77.392610.p1 type:complete len:275 gc:universal NODE_7631_length_921_cov_77.392610:51-875(+)